ncbi:uncharacterized protein LOC114479441 isoform X2 [Gouania willdenowi]|uniref:uncharacterized protein LOC114479441 isoform X2 n=1 Tax=Gouania willdenowi TaxID=441366 RepID=UPI0010554068|nr:uncharacterized protein LOC114479441 isoform X2 [Gouania willdenowi]
MSSSVKSGGSGWKIFPDSLEDMDDVGSFYSCSVKVEYYSSYEYSLKWKTSMYPQRSSRQQKVPKLRSQISPKDENTVQCRTRGRKRKGNPKHDNDGVRDIGSSHSFKNEVKEDRGESAGVSTKKKQRSEKPRLRGRKHDQDDDSFHTDPVDLINSSHTFHWDVKKAGGESVEVTSDKLDKSNEDDGASGCSSIHSGPSCLSPQKQRLSQFLCMNCHKLYQKAKKTKAPIKDKLLDNDPKSLTCDQWVLIKKWKPRRLTSCKGLLARLRFHKLVSIEEEYSAGCLRAHPFLQRNLRRVKMPPGKRMNRNKRKRTRLDSYSYQAVKQQRLQGNAHLQHVSIDGKNEDLVEVMGTTTTSVQQKPKKKSGFREQLMMLRGSTIVREMQ